MSMDCLIRRCWCGSHEFVAADNDGDYEIASCRNCGTIIQVLPASFDLDDWYQRFYHQDVYTHSFEHDYEVAKMRLRDYEGWLTEPILDVGCGNGAFVMHCASRGLAVFGQDPYATRIQQTTPLPLSFLRSKQFGLVTAHDVLEHVLDPIKFVSELNRLAKCKVIVEAPDFDCKRHWKPIEHLWHFGLEHYKAILSRFFRIKKADNPVPGKHRFFCEIKG